MSAPDLDKQARALEARYGRLPTEQLLLKVTQDLYPGRTAIVTSFGTESAVLLNLAARMNATIPVLFLDTGQHFAETLAYRDQLTAHLGLTDVRSVRPLPYQLSAADADGTLWSRDPDYCCHLRKVLPLEAALSEFDCWISGRKRHHGGDRETVRTFEVAAGRLQVNPLLHWTPAEIEFSFEAHRLPRHPLGRKGYGSIGCAVCTARTPSGGGIRSGRWAACGKTECGIHASLTLSSSDSSASVAGASP